MRGPDVSDGGGQLLLCCLGVSLSRVLVVRASSCLEHAAVEDGGGVTLGGGSSEQPTGAARNGDATVGHWNYRRRQVVAVADVDAGREGLAVPGGALR